MGSSAFLLALLPLAAAVCTGRKPTSVPAAVSPTTPVVASTQAAVTARASTAAGSKYPFDRLVVFGDELSDNGNGSFAHGITGNPANVYGFGTWTNGPVAVSFLADLLRVPLTADFAFGGCCGGGSFGATLDNAYTKSDGGADDMPTQVRNYTSRAEFKSVRTSLQVLWFGANDLTKHTDAFWLTDPNNANFATEIGKRLAAQVKTLLDAGAPGVVVPNIYPKHLAPVTAKYLCGAPDNDCVRTWGQVIQQANAAIQKSLLPFGKKALYYDTFSFVSGILANPAKFGFTKSLQRFCDGDGDASWKDCMEDGHAREYFWMNFIQPTAAAHQMIAVDMKRAIDANFS